MAIFNLLKLSMLLSVLSDMKLGSWPIQKHIVPFPPQCVRIECPKYEVVHSGDGYEIRLYNSATWAISSPIYDTSFVNATKTGFKQLFNYIQGENKYNEKMEMTAPVLTEIAQFCQFSGFVVSFYVPEKNQADPPPATGINVIKLGPHYVAVRQFSGFATDSNVCVEAAALSASLSGTIWSDAINKSGHAGEIVVALYNSPFEFDNRVNEIWFNFDFEEINRSVMRINM